jgi:hypothetical protein
MLMGIADKSRWDDVTIANPRGGRTLDLGHARWLQLTYEAAGDCRALFPPGLHPTSPVALTIQIWDVPGGDLGAFRLAQVRLSCRAGVRIRAFLLNNVISNPEVAKELSAGWGFANIVGDIDFLWRNDRIAASARVAGVEVLDMSLRSGAAIGPDDLHHSVNVNMARCEGELQLLQVDAHFSTQSIQRGKPHIASFDAAFWNLPVNAPTYPIIAAAAQVTLALTPVRYAQDPEMISQLGTKQLIDAVE